MAAGDTEVDAEIVGQKLKVRGSDVNLIFTVAGFIIICLTGYVAYSHAEDSKKTNREVSIELRDTNREIAKVVKESQQEMVIVLREMARATREQNCILSLPPMAAEQRRVSMDACKRNSQ